MTISTKNQIYYQLIKEYKNVLDEIQNAYATCDLLGNTMCIYTLGEYTQKLSNINSLIVKFTKMEDLQCQFCEKTMTEEAHDFCDICDECREEHEND